MCSARGEELVDYLESVPGRGSQTLAERSDLEYVSRRR